MTLLRRILLLLLLPIISIQKLSAEEDLLWLPDYFERVNDASQVEDGAYYLIAGTSQQDGHVLMSATVVNKKLKGIPCVAQDRILCTDPTLVWQLQRVGNEVIIRAAAEGKFIVAPKADKPEVELQANAYTTWILQQQGDGFTLKHSSQARRYLHTSYQRNADNPNPFGNYAYYDGTVETNVLYLYKLDADYAPPTDNTVTYLTDDDKVPVYGNLLVRNGALLYPSVLLDGMEFAPSEPFTVTAGQLTYTRTLEDGNWETLSLPFAASVPEGIDARELVSVDGDNLEFQPVTEIRANVPVILRSKVASGASVTFTSTGGTVSLPTEHPSALRPTYQHIYINSASEGIYLLAAEGMKFVRADSGSTLCPFRSFIVF